MLEEALQALGTMENREEKSKPVKPTSPGKAETNEEGQSQLQPSVETTIHEKGNQDTIWLDISESISKEFLGSLKYGVVGGWKSQQALDPPLTDLEAWAKRAWRLKGGVTFQNLSQNLFFMSLNRWKRQVGLWRMEAESSGGKRCI